MKAHFFGTIFREFVNFLRGVHEDLNYFSVFFFVNDFYAYLIEIISLSERFSEKQGEKKTNRNLF